LEQLLSEGIITLEMYNAEKERQAKEEVERQARKEEAERQAKKEEAERQAKKEEAERHVKFLLYVQARKEKIADLQQRLNDENLTDEERTKLRRQLDEAMGVV